MEKRSFKRIPAEAQVIVKAIEGDHTERAESQNLSGGGILFTSRELYEEGRILEIEVEAPSHENFSHSFPPLKALVIVVRVDAQVSPYEVAAQFLEIY